MPLYILAQLMGSTLASCTLALMFDVASDDYFGTVPAGSDGQSLAIEIIISFLLMFVISGVATDSRAVILPICIHTYIFFVRLRFVLH